MPSHKGYSLVAIPPQRFDKYTLIGKLGHGGMAEVNLAVVEGKGGFRKLTVIKRLHAHLAVEPGFIDMFLDEARLGARLNHPHCVQTYEVGEVEDNPFLAMEYLDGQGLERLLRISGQQNKPIPIPLAARIVADALDGLSYAHELTDYDGSALAVVHRDVSPQNIFVTYTGMVKLLDFGIAKAATHIVVTKTGVIKGKYAYIAPEQALGQDVDERSDLWSMGVVLWEVLTGHRLFKSVNELATLHETLQGEIKLPSAFRPELPTELDTICNRALQRDPAERYQNAAEMKDELERYLRSVPDAPGRRQIGHLMKDRFGAVIEHHKRTLSDCLTGTGKMGTETVQRLIPKTTSSDELLVSGMLAAGAVTPTPTPAPWGAPHSGSISVTPPPLALPPAGTVDAPEAAAEPASSKGWLLKAALVIGVVLIALLLGLFLPLGDDPEQVVRRPSATDPELGTNAGLARGSSDRAAVTDDTDPAVGAATTDPASADPQPQNLQPQTPEAQSPQGQSPQANDPSRTDPSPSDDPGSHSSPADQPSDGLAAGSGTDRITPAEQPVAERATQSAERRRRREERRLRAREAAAAAATPPPASPPEPRPAVAETGRLTLATTPWTEVSLNGRPLGTTPLLRIELPAGPHTLRLVNQAAGIDRTYRVVIPAGGLLTRRVGL